MKYRYFTLIASFFLTLAIVVIVFLFDLSQEYFLDKKKNFRLAVILVLVFLWMTNFIILELLFSFYGKKQIQRISNIFPDDILSQEELLTFKELGKKLTELSQIRSIEKDTLQEMEKYRKEYIGNVSHELKTPLFSIQGYLETLKDGAIENIAVRDKYLERIDKSVERLLNIVTDLDMINQYESSEIKLNITSFDINTLIKEIIDFMDLEAQNNKAKIQLLTYQNQVFVKADKQKISQVLINLISNAIHYANRENTLISIKIASLRNKIIIQVSDNGMGIKPEAIPRIFERFYRVESSRNRREGGSGLGLAIVKHILEAHNEKITVDSVYLEGTTFSFMLDKA